MNAFRALLGPDYDALPAAVRAYHDHRRAHYVGTAFSGGATHFAAQALRWVFGFPKPAERMEVEIWLSVAEDRQVWRRRFGDRRFSSSFHAGSDGTLDEKFGPFRFAFRLRSAGNRMYWDFAGWRVFGVPLPRALGPRIETYETEDAEGRFVFYSHADFPLMGRLVHYHGQVTLTDQDADTP